MFNKHRTRIGFFLLLVLSLTLPQTGLAQSSSSIVILTPGDGSEVSAPISVTAELYPGADDLVRVTLIDQKDTLLVRQLLRVDSEDDNTPIQFTTSLAYEIPTEDTTALLTIATQDDYHRPQALRSVTLTLRTDGQAVIQSQTSDSSWLTVTEPVALDILGGGQITVRGTVTPVNTNPVRFELINDNGITIGSAQLLVLEAGETVDFDVSLSYAYVTTITDVRLVIRQTSDEFASNVILDSVPIALTP